MSFHEAHPGLATVTITPLACQDGEVLPDLTRQGLVYTYRHDGFFKSLDSAKDQQEFDYMVRSGKAG